MDSLKHPSHTSQEVTQIVVGHKAIQVAVTEVGVFDDQRVVVDSNTI